MPMLILCFGRVTRYLFHRLLDPKKAHELIKGDCMPCRKVLVFDVAPDDDKPNTCD